MIHNKARHFAQKAFLELTGNILPFWMKKAIDKQNGGFVGQIDGKGQVKNNSGKGGILNARILWTFSAAYNLLHKQEYLNVARRSKEYIFKYFIDPVYGGTYWALTPDGLPADPKKQIYAQAFFIYGLTEYYKATGDGEALDTAISLYNHIEEASFDTRENGYLEAFSREWTLLKDLRLSDKDANEKKTTNTHLHILESYTNLYEVWPNPQLEKKLRNLIFLFTDRIINPVSFHLNLFFDEHWINKSSLISFGHDIEASWLIMEGAKKLNDALLLSKVKQTCCHLAVASLEGLQEDGSLIYEKDESKGLLNKDLHWWPQAETVVGLLNLFELTGNETYFQNAIKTWTFIENKMIDASQGEWYWSIRNGIANTDDDKAGFWKCPYHNSRACMEIIKRLEKL
jgi:cellobiose epimerase